MRSMCGDRLSSPRLLRFAKRKDGGKSRSSAHLKAFISFGQSGGVLKTNTEGVGKNPFFLPYLVNTRGGLVPSDPRKGEKKGKGSGLLISLQGEKKKGKKEGSKQAERIHFSGKEGTQSTLSKPANDFPLSLWPGGGRKKKCRSHCPQ